MRGCGLFVFLENRLPFIRIYVFLVIYTPPEKETITVTHFVRQNPAMAYVRQIPATLIEAGLLLAAVWAGCVALLYAGSMLWHLYLETPMGQQFLQLFPEKSSAVAEIMNGDMIGFATRLTLTAFVICVSVAAASRFFYIGRLLYDSMGMAGKLTAWGVPLTAAVTCAVYQTAGLTGWEVIAVFAAIPTYCLFMNCFRYTAMLVPEAGRLLSLLWQGYCRLWQWATGRPVPDLSPLLDRLPFRFLIRTRPSDQVVYKFSLKGWLHANYRRVLNELRNNSN